MGRIKADHYSSLEGHNNSMMQRVRDMGSDGILGHLVPAGNFALQLGGCGDGRSWSEGRSDDGDGGRPGARGGGGEKEEQEELRKSYFW